LLFITLAQRPEAIIGRNLLGVVSVRTSRSADGFNSAREAKRITQKLVI
jgi:hypothetical protein